MQVFINKIKTCNEENIRLAITSLWFNVNTYVLKREGKSIYDVQFWIGIHNLYKGFKVL